MTLLDILTKAGLAAEHVIALLEQAAISAPDLAPSINDLILKLQTVVDPANLAALAASLPAEVLEIAKGHLNPKSHPSDLA